MDLCSCYYSVWSLVLSIRKNFIGLIVFKILAQTIASKATCFVLFHQFRTSGYNHITV